MQLRHVVLLCLPFLLLVGCGRRPEAPKPIALEPAAAKKFAEPDAETLRRQAEAAKKAQELKEARAKHLEKIKAAQEAEAKVKKELDDALRAYLDEPKNRTNLRGYRTQAEKIKESEGRIKALKLQIGEIIGAGNANETVRADLEDQLLEEDRRLADATVAVKGFFAKARGRT